MHLPPAEHQLRGPTGPLKGCTAAAGAAVSGGLWPFPVHARMDLGRPRSGPMIRKSGSWGMQ
ncbi:twin-arginine translocation signal domain-containing protein [Nonomuraea maritima]|uniref:twin-arginine translocation signal domain-containing protein n=1 Tax=Nonomuraea maritima TaxID=683260 RepID=UPI003CCC1A03